MNIQYYIILLVSSLYYSSIVYSSEHKMRDFIFTHIIIVHIIQRPNKFYIHIFMIMTHYNIILEIFLKNFYDIKNIIVSIKKIIFDVMKLIVYRYNTAMKVRGTYSSIKY